MRVSVVNFCSTRADMLAFSTEMLLQNAGAVEFDYYLVTWLPSPEVRDFAERHPATIKHVEHETVPGLAYVPQLRAMMNHGFDVGYAANDWTCLVNTDMAFGEAWLERLAAAAEDPGTIPNSVHITPTKGRAPGIVPGNFGVPTLGTFDLAGFRALHDRLRSPGVLVPAPPLTWENVATFPYLLHRQWWEKCGPWELNYIPGQEAPDRRFFRRCAGAGARFVLVRDSIVYHHEAVERRGARPVGAEHLPEN